MNPQLPHGYLRIATACPEVRVSDVDTNVARIRALYAEAVAAGVAVVAFPELCVTGYTLGDVVVQQVLLTAAERGVARLAALTASQTTCMVVGMPLQVGNGLYNVACVLAHRS